MEGGSGLFEVVVAVNAEDDPEYDEEIGKEHAEDLASVLHCDFVASSQGVPSGIE